MTFIKTSNKGGLNKMHESKTTDSLNRLINNVRNIETTKKDKKKSTSVIEAEKSLLSSLLNYTTNNQSKPTGEIDKGEFPLSIFPKQVQDFLKQASDSLQCPMDFIAVPILVCAGIAVGNSTVIEAKKGWIEGGRIYCGIVAEPGSKKTPALNLAMAGIQKIQQDEDKKYSIAFEDYHTRQAVYDLELDSWKKRMPKNQLEFNEDKPLPPEFPNQSQIITSDATWEALAEMMENNNRGILFFRDELIGWVKAMDQYRAKGSDRQNWLSIWSGEPIYINRKGKRTNIKCPFVSVVGGIQPDLLGTLMHGEKNDGFIDRILFSFPEPTPSYWSDIEMDQKTMDSYETIFHKLYCLPYNKDGSSTKIHLNKSAKELFREWHDLLQHEMNDPEFPSFLKGTWAKMPGYFLRLSLILHLLHYVCYERSYLEIEDETILAGIRLTNYFKSHSKKVYSLLHKDKLTISINKAIDHINKNAPNKLINLRDFQRLNISGVKTKKDVLRLFQEIKERGYGDFVEKLNKNGRISLFFKLF